MGLLVQFSVLYHFFQFCSTFTFTLSMAVQWACGDLWQRENSGLSNTHSIKIFVFFFFFTPNLGLTPPVTYNPNARRSDAYTGNNSLWNRSLERYTSECVVSTMSGPPPKTTQDRTKYTHTPNTRTEIKIADPAANRTRAAGLEGRDSTDHATANNSTKIWLRTYMTFL